MEHINTGENIAYENNNIIAIESSMEHISTGENIAYDCVVNA